MGKSKIEWCDAVWNVMSGCSKISSGCKFCYAEGIALRLKSMVVKGYENGFEVTLHPERLDEPFRWIKSRRIFICSMGDLFHEKVPDNFIDKAWYTMSFNPHHIFMILTKRPERALKVIKAQVIKRAGIKPNIWIGITAENQEMADKRIPILLQIPASVRFVSFEPMLEPIVIQNLHGKEPCYLGRFICTECNDEPPGFECNCCVMNTEVFKIESGIDWVICGSESGSHRRSFNEQWARDLKDQCVVAGVPFFYKQGIQNGKFVKMPELDGKVWAEVPKRLAL